MATQLTIGEALQAALFMFNRAAQQAQQSDLPEEFKQHLAALNVECQENVEALPDVLHDHAQSFDYCSSAYAGLACRHLETETNRLAVGDGHAEMTLQECTTDCWRCPAVRFAGFVKPPQGGAS